MYLKQLSRMIIHLVNKVTLFSLLKEFGANLHRFFEQLSIYKLVQTNISFLFWTSPWRKNDEIY